MELCQSSSVVERFLGKKEAVGSIPTFGSNKYKIVGIERRTESFSTINLKSSQDPRSSLFIPKINILVPF